MPVALDRADRRLVGGAFALLVVLVVASALLQPKAIDGPEASSYSYAANGAQAAYQLLGTLGYHVERWESPLSDLPTDAKGVVLVLAEPNLRTAGAQDREQLRSFVERGGRLLATGASVADALPGAGVTRTNPIYATTQTYSAAAPSLLNRRAPQITTDADEGWDSPLQAAVPLYAKDGNIVAVEYPFGRGDVIWVASAMPFTNSTIAQTNDLNFLLNIVGGIPGGAGDPANTRVLWDEYYHGVRRSLGSYIAGTPIIWALAQSGLIYLFVIVGFGRRTGPLRKPVVESRLSPLEFVETLGALYHRAHAAPSAVEAEWQRFRFLVTRRLGLPASAPVGQIYNTVRERLHWSEPGLFETMQEADRASSDAAISETQALRIVSSLEHYIGLLQLNPRAVGEKSSWQNK